MRIGMVWMVAAIVLSLAVTAASADPSEDFCNAMRDQLVACQKEAAQTGGCYNAVISVIDKYEEASKTASPAQEMEMDKAVNLWADMAKTINPQGDEAPKKKAIATLCERIRQSK